MDSELQIALIGAGLGVVVLIVGYNKWQERKHRNKAEKAFKSEHRDVLLEPRGGGSADERDERSERREPGFGSIGDVGEAGDGPRPVREASIKRSAPELPALLDTRTDCVIRLEAIEPLDVQRVWQAQLEQIDGLSKPVRWFGFNDAENVWFPIGSASAGACHWFCAALQLVDRRGSIGESDFMRFSGGVQRVADLVMALPPGVPARGETLHNAAELDRFCADVDVQIGVNIVATERPFEGLEIGQFAARHDLTFASDGSFHALADDGTPLFALANLEAGLFADGELSSIATRGVTLVIDVPCVRDGVAAFDRMMEIANGFARQFGGTVVDDNRAPFGTEAAELIRSQIRQFQDRMAESAIPAGGPLARRLFAL
ncbi:cell division protein ZipA C-terminal FtsZ-binding domain-containing protein [Thauera linaloolentis]|uniref:Cell division protein ZipA n=1 Tax=Thauera linaloolentis (strain DSM 12138 / JCM 21573 / CCUG 41526 / CIP 105981 / IAM 15112 / NBRC 102519 / 47Lol) TaxID=1123367 RepID=N6Z6V2_THAL4|nr:cell division protein ZipA C-terminal FtsZ-binding domain-containing protein [Thauera linaloolentis]ENO90282.1 hypothetical protein C666_02420 [Thauera linaloolentis 47Lol = DSM 12138]MCM8566229.1 ZipA [Thauera linaloolentis]